MIVGTAGHIDHGKTMLVRALTGVDTDRLPEEKRRGISIDLGFAYVDGDDAEGGERIGFVDVPGHERLVHTMLAGATGIDHGLLVVAADDGVMPQTREHLAVLSLLDIRAGLIVITKADRVDAARIDAVRQEIAALVADTSFAEAPVFVVSATDGTGVDAVLTHLRTEARRRPRPVDARGWRLAIDRVFTIDGTGVVVTGTSHAGRVRVGDRLVVVPGDTGQREVRVRSIHAQNRAVEQAEARQRCALGLVGIERDQVRRGDWVVAPGFAQTTERLDARLRLWPREARVLRAGTRVQLHLGAASVAASAVPLGADRLAPGDEGWVQLVLQRPIAAWRGDRVVLRDAAASRTL
ncbi:MAG: selenocysteine-specific translation elongation factor, partial [Burkholderiaceae bacterium]